MRQSLYYVNESAGSVVVCYDVLSGRTATRSISMQLRTVQGEAEGNLHMAASCMILNYHWMTSTFHLPEVSIRSN